MLMIAFQAQIQWNVFKHDVGQIEQDSAQNFQSTKANLQFLPAFF